jgi:pimeloyl-ACP methyl ester carboxylesterase
MLRACLIPFVVVTAATSAVAQTPPAKSTPPSTAYVAPSPPGDLIDIGGRRLHIQCEGKGTAPTVIFEAGLSQYTAHSTYGKAQDLITSFARVCTYDRAGLGWSDPALGARTQQDMVDDLHKLVKTDGLKRPLVLVGHSMGGLLARLYAKRYPSEVAGLVLVDASPETVIFGPGATDVRKGIVAEIDKGLQNAKEDTPIVPMPTGTAAETMMAFTPKILRAVKQEYLAIDRVPESLRAPQGYGMFGDKPLAVIRRGSTTSPPSENDKAWREAQEAMTSLSRNSFLVVAEKSGHVIPYEQPEIVADTVRRILDEIKNAP